MSDTGILRRLRNNSTTPTPPPSPATPKLSERMAAAVEQMEGLEAELAAANMRAAAYQVRAEKAEELLDDAKVRLAKLQGERDDASTHLAAVEAKLQASAGIILDCLKKPVVENYRPKSEGHRAVARALAGDEEGPKPAIPDFLSKPQPDEEP